MNKHIHMHALNRGPLKRWRACGYGTVVIFGKSHAPQPMPMFAREPHELCGFVVLQRRNNNAGGWVSYMLSNALSTQSLSLSLLVACIPSLEWRRQIVRCVLYTTLSYKYAKQQPPRAGSRPFCSTRVYTVQYIWCGARICGVCV